PASRTRVPRPAVRPPELCPRRGAGTGWVRRAGESRSGARSGEDSNGPFTHHPRLRAVSTIVAPGSLVADAELDAMHGIAEQGLPAFLTDLERLVNVDCGSYTPAGVNNVADWVADDMLSNGGRVERLPDPSGRFGDTVVGTFEGTTGAGPRLLLIGHMDTVFEEGTAAERHCRIEGCKAMGPGVSDMKGGLLLGLRAVKALRAFGGG